MYSSCKAIVFDRRAGTDRALGDNRPARIRRQENPS